MKRKLVLIILQMLLFCSCARRTTVPPALPGELAGLPIDTAAIPLPAPEDDYYEQRHFRTEDFIYSEKIKTVLLHPDGEPLDIPLLHLNGEDKLRLRFDDLGGGFQHYYYTILHCDSRWNPSPIQPSDYIDGFPENQITDYTYSVNTLQKYTHYTTLIPNGNMQPKISGNYLLIVYRNQDPTDRVFTRRFAVVEQTVTVEMTLRRATLVQDRNFKQEVDFVIRHNSYTIDDPYNNITVVITQNNRWDNAVTNLKPLYVKDQLLVYDYDKDNTFYAGSEFRYFDITTFRFRTERVQEIIYDTSGQNVYLVPDHHRSFMVYSAEKDIHGGFLIRNRETSEPHATADYSKVHFFLPQDAPLIDGNLYIAGACTYRRLDDATRMNYNYQRKGYETTFYLKQGFYNYEYLFLADGQKAGDQTLIEGSHSETQNLYTIYVYHKAFTGLYDRLIAVERKISGLW